MAASEVEFVFADTWLLTAILMNGRKSANLRELIGTMDYINHGIPTCDELNGALERLGRAGLLTRRGSRYRTKAIVEELAPPDGKRFATHKLVDKVRTFLAGYRQSGRYPARTLPAITEREYSEAYQDYRTSF
jgi:hypothetical protein